MTITPVEYVEDGLGAHKVWEDSQQVTADLRVAMRTRDSLVASRRQLQFEIEELENGLAKNVRNRLVVSDKPPSQAQLDREIKLATSRNEQHTALRTQIMDAQSHIDEAESEVRSLEFKARALTARMHELSAVLAFYTACKSAETEARRMQVTHVTNAWPF